MKKLITTCVLVAAASFASFAQSKTAAPKSSATATNSTKVAATAPTPAQVAERRAKGYQQQFGLNAKQYKGVYEAELDYETQMAGFKANGVQPGEGQAAQMGMGRDYRIKQSMTAEQYTKYEAAKKTN